MTGSRPSTRAHRDGGVTLIEMLVVVAVLGLIAAVIAAAFVVVVRTSPTTEARIDDSRTILGLTIYLPEDVNSTPPSGYDFVPSTSTGCAGASPGVNLVRLTWTELSNTYRASYRYTGDSDGYKVVRYSCANGGDADVISLTSDLPPIDESTWTAGSAPIVVTPYISGADVVGLTFEATTFAGEQFFVVARSNNTADTLPPNPPVVYPPPPPGNQPPVASPVVATIPLAATSTIALAGTDPDADQLTASISNVPSDWTVVSSGAPGDLDIQITPPPAASLTDTATFDYTVTDPYGQVSSSTVDISLAAAAPNQAPVAGDVTETIDERTATIIDLPVSDPDSDPLTVSVAGVPSSLTVSVAGTQLVVESDGTTATPGSFTYSVSDGQDTATANVNVSVVLCQVTGLSPSNPSVAKFTNGTFKDTLKSDVTFTVSSTGNCANTLTLWFDNDSNGSLDNVTFNPTTQQVTFRQKQETWTNSTDSSTILFVVEVYKSAVPTGFTATMRVSK